jgi:hypothetical protein
MAIWIVSPPSLDLVATSICELDLAHFGSRASQPLQILRDQLKAPDDSPSSSDAWRVERTIETMSDVIVDQRFLGALDRAFDGLELLCDLGARPPLFDHFYDLFQMAVSALQTAGGRRVRVI